MYKFKPILKTLVWGTESWVLSGVPGFESVVAEGPEAGRKITDLWPGEFPLLIKFIDAKRDLSIQVHPNDELAARRHGCKGKTEMWYVIGAEPGAKLLSGLKEKITPDDYVRLVAEDRITEVLAEQAVAPGDVFFLPAGRIHAIGGGCLLAEIQQTSDITYRIYDYNRPGLDGKPRPLHTELAQEAIDYTVYPDYRTHYEVRQNAPVELVKCPYFTTTLLDLTKPEAETAPLSVAGSMDSSQRESLSRHSGRDPESPAFLILIGLNGSGKVTTEADETTLQAGEAILVPAADGPVTFLPGPGGLRLLTTHP
ncbi:MAG: class I mannose-6-phosphate isomerase [Bacteroidales bacterium]|nr:class I mannose-6-phosphate isomerase [Bacteroidales bacterium]